MFSIFLFKLYFKFNFCEIFNILKINLKKASNYG